MEFDGVGRSWMKDGWKMDEVGWEIDEDGWKMDEDGWKMDGIRIELVW